MSYSYITYAQARLQLGARLGDSGGVFWQNSEAQPEIGSLLRESLRAWNCACGGYWKTRMEFVTSAGVPFYDLTVQSDSPLSFTVTDQELIGLMEYSLLEPYSPSGWAGTSMFSLSDLSNALQRRRNQFLLETGMIVTRSALAVPSVPVSRIIVPDNVMNPRWLWWKDTTSSQYTSLRRTDEFALNAFMLGWAQNAQNTTVPETYSVAVSPPLTIQLAPAPQAIGSLDMLSINAPPDLNPATGVLMNIPDDFTWVIRMGALADLLMQDGTARDSARSAYCEQRYQEGVALARMAASALQVRVNDVPVPCQSLQSIESYRWGWRNNNPAQPDTSAMASWNMLVLANTPDAVYGITADVVQNAPVPVKDDDEIQIGREELEAVLGYGQHLGSFKQGGQEFQDTMQLEQDFYRLASVYNEELRANAVFWPALGDRAVKPIQSKRFRDSSTQQEQQQ